MELKIPRKEYLTQRVGVRLNDDEHQWIVGLAEQSGDDVYFVVRHLIGQQMEKVTAQEAAKEVEGRTGPTNHVYAIRMSDMMHANLEATSITTGKTVAVITRNLIARAYNEWRS